MNKGLKLMLVFFGLGIIAIILAFVFSEFAQEGDRIIPSRKQALELFYSTSYRIQTLDTTLIVNEDVQFIHIYYSIDNIRKDDPFIAIILPYSGSLREGDHSWQSEPMQHDSTLIYKQFSCDKENCNYHPYEDYDGTPNGVDQDNLLFEVKGKMDSKKAGEHALNVPVHGVQTEINLYVQKNVITQPVYKWRTSFDNVSNAKLAISIPDEATRLNFYPENPHTRYVFLQSSNRTVFEWNIPHDRTVFHIDYSMSSEIERSEFHSNVAALLTGVGITFFITGIAEAVKFRIDKNTN